MQKLIMANANLIDVVGPHGGLGSIVISGEVIEEILPGPFSHPTPADCTFVNLMGRSIMPGMFSCHFHASYPGLPLAAKRLPIGSESPPMVQAFQAAHNAGLALEAGFTSIVSAGCPFAIDAALKIAIDHGHIAGPRITAGSRDISTTGHSLDQLFPWHWDGFVPPSIVNCDTEGAFRQAVRQEIKRGAEIIKVFATAGHGVPGKSGLVDITRGELAAVVEAAHGRGVKVRAHIANLPGIEMALDVGVDLIDHGDGLDEHNIERMVRQGTFLAPSMLFSYRASNNPHNLLADQMRSELENMSAMLVKAQSAGLKIVLGDDYGTMVLQHGEYADELDFYVNVVGIAPRHVLQWATVQGADLAGQSGKLGVLRAGAIADLLIIDGDPLEDVGLLRDLTKISVIKGGSLIRNGSGLDPF